MLSNAFSKFKQYPKVAQVKGWQGLVVVELQLSPHGEVLYAHIKKSSGFEILDNEALSMVRKASPLPTPPELLRLKNFIVLVPISFRLE